MPPSLRSRGSGKQPPWTNREATTAELVPERLIILGGGVVGCELAQAWSSLGSKVAVVEATPRPLAGEEPFVSDQLAESLRDRGVDVRVGSKALEAARDDRGTFTLTLESGERIEGDELLVAVGRKPHTRDLGLETVDLAPGETVPVDDRMRVPGHPWLYAIEVTSTDAPCSTHAGKYQARVAVAAIMNRELSAQWDGPRTPRVVYTELQVRGGRPDPGGRARGRTPRPGNRRRDRQDRRSASFVGKGARSTAPPGGRPAAPRDRGRDLHRS